VSADFLGSEFITEVELPSLLLAAETQGLRVVPVIVKPCRFRQTAQLSAFQSLNPPERPVMAMTETEREVLWVRLSEEIEAAVTVRTPYGAVLADPALAPTRAFRLPYERNPFFAGRREVLQQIDHALTTTGKAGLCGLGGIGKTQAAVEYAYEHEDQYDVIFWTAADSELALAAGLTDLSRLLGLREASEASEVLSAAAARQWLERHSRWLLILDNADHPEIVRKFRPQSTAGHLVLTSRRSNLDALGIVAPIELVRMNEAEAVEFLLARTGRSDEQHASERHAALLLARELGCLPLALEQAGAYLVANLARFQDYLRSYRRRRIKVLPAPVTGEYAASVATTWAMNFREVEQTPAAAEVLRLSAFLAADNIPLELIAKGAPDLGATLAEALVHVEEDPVLLNETLEPLTRYSLVRRDLHAHTYSIHRIMQAVLLDEMDPELQRLWAERALAAVARVFPTPDYRQWPACERLLPHVQVLADLVVKWNIASTGSARLFNDAGVYLRRRGQFGSAEALLTLARRQTEAILGPDAPDTAQILNTLAALYRELKRYTEAEPLAARARAIREAAFGPNHPQVAKSLTTIGLLFRDQGRLAEAEPLLQRALEIDEAAFGREHPNMAVSLTTFGSLCHDLGRQDKAESLLRRALTLEERALGAEDPRLAWSLEALGRVCQGQHRYEEAESLYARALELRSRALGPEHPHVLSTLDTYASLLREWARPMEHESGPAGALGESGKADDDISQNSCKD
jgi:tetratricopeptide (TPR) repeat protein